jgi:hypothetical protein
MSWPGWMDLIYLVDFHFSFSVLNEPRRFPISAASLFYPLDLPRPLHHSIIFPSSLTPIAVAHPSTIPNHSTALPSQPAKTTTSRQPVPAIPPDPKIHLTLWADRSPVERQRYAGSRNSSSPQRSAQLFVSSAEYLGLWKSAICRCADTKDVWHAAPPRHVSWRSCAVIVRDVLRVRTNHGS